MRYFIIILAFAATLTPLTASLTDAQRIEKTYQLALENWKIAMLSSTTQATRDQLLITRPDAATAVTKMWEKISNSLNEDWTLQPAAWYIRTASGIAKSQANGRSESLFASQIDLIRKSVEAHHLKSQKLMPLCAALALTSDPRSLALLEKIQNTNPDNKTQGVAALGAAIQLKTLGDEPDIMRKRLNYLRKAIIESSEVELENASVAKLAQDELYIIQYLSKGRIAPDLVGKDAAGQMLSLSALKGKIVVLLFWNSQVPDAQRVVEITTAMAAKFQKKPLAVIGVNNDPLDKMRSLIADNTVTWPNYSDPENTLAAQYRIGTWPLVYVLDGERKIHYTGAPGSFVELTASALLQELKPTESR